MRSRGADRSDDEADEQTGRSRRLFGRPRPEPVEPEEIPQEETGWLDDLRTAKEQRAAIGPGPRDGAAAEDEPPSRRGRRPGGRSGEITPPSSTATAGDVSGPLPSPDSPSPYRPAVPPSSPPAPPRTSAPSSSAARPGTSALYPEAGAPPAALPYGRADIIGRPISAPPPGTQPGRPRSPGSGEQASGPWQTVAGRGPAAPTSPVPGTRHGTPEPGRHTSELNPDPTFRTEDAPGHGRRQIDRELFGGPSPAVGPHAGPSSIDPTSAVPLSGNAPAVPPVRPAPVEPPRGRGASSPAGRDYVPGGSSGARVPGAGRPPGPGGPDYGTRPPAADFPPGPRQSGADYRTGPVARPPTGPVARPEGAPTGAHHSGEHPMPDYVEDGSDPIRPGGASRPVSAVPSADGSSFGSRNTGSGPRIRPGVANPEGYPDSEPSGRHGASGAVQRSAAIDPAAQHPASGYPSADYSSAPYPAAAHQAPQHPADIPDDRTGPWPGGRGPQNPSGRPGAARGPQGGGAAGAAAGAVAGMGASGTPARATASVAPPVVPGRQGVRKPAVPGRAGAMADSPSGVIQRPGETTGRGPNVGTGRVPRPGGGQPRTRMAPDPQAGGRSRAGLNPDPAPSSRVRPGAVDDSPSGWVRPGGVDQAPSGRVRPGTFDQAPPGYGTGEPGYGTREPELDLPYGAGQPGPGFGAASVPGVDRLGPIGGAPARGTGQIPGRGTGRVSGAVAASAVPVPSDFDDLAGTNDGPAPVRGRTGALAGSGIRPAATDHDDADDVGGLKGARSELRRQMRAKRRLRVVTLVSLSVVVLGLLPLLFGIRAATRDPVFTSIDALDVPGWAATGVQDQSSGSRWCFLECRFRERTAQSLRPFAQTGKVYSAALVEAGWQRWKVGGCPDQPIRPEDGVYTCWRRDEFTLDLWVRLPECAVDARAAQDPAAIPSIGANGLAPTPDPKTCVGSTVSIKVQNAITDTRGKTDNEKPGLTGETPDPVLSNDPLLPTPSPS